MSQFNWGTAIGPGITRHQRNADDAAFVAALKVIHPNDIFPKDQHMLDTTNHPTIHCNRIEPAGNVLAGKGVGAHVVEKHGIGAKETPAATSPEVYMDRFEHQNVTKAIMLIEAALINSAPDASGEFVAVVFNSTLTGRAKTLVELAYVDVGWSAAKIMEMDLTRSSIKLEF